MLEQVVSAMTESGASVGVAAVSPFVQTPFDEYKAYLIDANDPAPGDNGGSGFGFGFQLMCGSSQIFSFGAGGGGGVGLR